MAENKKSFILYADLNHTLAKVPDDVAGRLFKVILEYVNDNNPTIEDDLLLEVLFEPIKQTLKRDLQRWEQFRFKQSENGKKGGRPLKNNHLTDAKNLHESIDKQYDILKIEESEKNPKNPSLNLESQKSLSVSVNVSDSVNDSVNASVTENVIVTEIKKNNIEERKLKFASTLKPFLDTYGKEMLNDFYLYWTEPTKLNNKFRQELQKTWGIERRLQTWYKNDFKNKEKSSEKKESKISQLKSVSDELDIRLGINQNNQLK
jgi:hypothetical protein